MKAARERPSSLTASSSSASAASSIWIMMRFMASEMISLARPPAVGAVVVLEFERLVQRTTVIGGEQRQTNPAFAGVVEQGLHGPSRMSSTAVFGQGED